MSLSRWKMMAGVLGVSLGGLAAASQCPKTGTSKSPGRQNDPPSLELPAPPPVAPAGAPAMKMPPAPPAPLDLPTPAPTGSAPMLPPPAPSTPSKTPSTLPPVELPATPVSGPTTLPAVIPASGTVPKETPPPLPAPEPESPKAGPATPPPAKPEASAPGKPTLPPPSPAVEPPGKPTASLPSAPPAVESGPLPSSPPSADFPPPKPDSKPTPPALGTPLPTPPAIGSDPLIETRPAPRPTPVAVPDGGTALIGSSATKALATQPKYRILLRVGEGEPTFEVKSGDDLLLKVTCEKVDIKSPDKGNGLSAVKASGKVRFAGFGAEGTCDELSFLAGTGEVSMSGTVKIAVKDKLGRVESELSTETVKYKIDPSAAVVKP